jgi:D-cysteine desulfhydrase family pyridoxal phosphate-dependent enzyme
MTTGTASVTTALDQRIRLAALPTPLEPLDRLARHLGMRPGTLWAKRDDLTGLGLGGNKVRKLEYLCADAIARKCDILVTGAAVQSNHCRQTAAAARRLGLDCLLLLDGEPPGSVTGNLLLDHLLGAQIEFTNGQDLERALEQCCERLARQGRRPALIPPGGSNAIGGLGYVRAADELLAQLPGFDTIVVATGSCGTHAGLAAGLGSFDRLLGIQTRERPNVNDRVARIASGVAERAGRSGRSDVSGQPNVDSRHIGAGYGDLTTATREAIHLVARLEGMFLDPVYTGKVMAGLIANVREGTIGPANVTVFLHTGGTPALFADRYHDIVSGQGEQ